MLLFFVLFLISLALGLFFAYIKSVKHKKRILQYQKLNTSFLENLSKVSVSFSSANVELQRNELLNNYLTYTFEKVERVHNDQPKSRYEEITLCDIKHKKGKALLAY